MPPKEKYTDPKLRDEVKEEIHKGDKGGAPGQWSARKAQLMASEYKKRGGDYNTDKKDQDSSQKHLSEWGEEDWQTKDGSGNAKNDDGTEQRYLPKKAWDKMSEKEKKETDEKKQEGSKQGKQHVGNTAKAKESREEAHEDAKGKKHDEEETKASKKKGETESTNKNENSDQDSDDEEYDDDDHDDEAADSEDESNNEDEDENSLKPKGQKRTRSQEDDNENGDDDNSNNNNKKQKSDNKSNATVGSEHDPATPPAPAGSSTRLPKENQNVTWKALPGYIQGTVVEIVTTEKPVDGKKVKGSEKGPRIVLKSDESGKIAVHKPEAVFFED
ncbi:hypothetical protein AAFC00_006245 [Neodothiora populina]|uniref:Hypervirulence associated protein TUDOR domain-containing protein n=1 Tax=Neodothiora populina TaxID=2781224 RepID=A0ABR3P4S8_9PEZI